MNQPTSIQMLDAAIWQELGGEKANDAEVVYHTLGTLLSRWLLARSDYPEMEAVKLFAKFRRMSPNRNVSCNRVSEESGMLSLILIVGFELVQFDFAR
jgi:hypothetical protein